MSITRERGNTWSRHDTVTSDNTALQICQTMEENSTNELSHGKLCSFKSCTLKILNKNGDLVKAQEKLLNVVVVSESDERCVVNIQDGKPVDNLS